MTRSSEHEVAIDRYLIIAQPGLPSTLISCYALSNCLRIRVRALQCMFDKYCLAKITGCHTGDAKVVW